MTRRPKQTKAQILARLEEHKRMKADAQREAERLIQTGAEAEVVTVEETVDGVKRARVAVKARRVSCFVTMLPAGSRELAAVDWLSELIGTANGDLTPERRPDHIRASTEGAPGQNVTQQMIEASAELVIIEESIPGPKIRMIYELLKPENRMVWRDVVQFHTGERMPHAQAAAVRLACQDLAWVRDNAPRLVRERKERRMAA